MILRNRSESRHRDTAFEGQHHDLPSPSPMYSQTLTRQRTSGTSWKPPLLTSTGCRKHVSSSCIVHRRSMPCHRSPRRGFATFTPTHLHAAETGSNLSFAAYSRTHCSRLLLPLWAQAGCTVCYCIGACSVEAACGGRARADVATASERRLLHDAKARCSTCWRCKRYSVCHSGRCIQPRDCVSCNKINASH